MVGACPAAGCAAVLEAEAVRRRPSEPIAVRNAELATVRDAMRELNRMVDRLEAGELEKVVLMRGARMVAVLLPIAPEGDS